MKWLIDVQVIKIYFQGYVQINYFNQYWYFFFSIRDTRTEE